MATIIQATLDYKLFSRIKSNRELNPSHLKRLKKSIEQKNYLYLFPIIINKDMEIVDGQHRLQAAIDLKLPIFYMIDDKITKAEIAMVNSNRKGWSAMDYIEYYAKEGNKVYDKVIKVLKEYPIGKMVAITLITDNVGNDSHGGKASVMFKTGDINDKHYDLAIKILKFCDNLSNKGFDYAFKREFVIPLKALVCKSSLGIDSTLKKVESNLPRDIDKIPYYLTSTRIELSKPDKGTSRKIEAIPHPVKKDIFKGKEILTAKDFKDIF